METYQLYFTVDKQTTVNNFVFRTTVVSPAAGAYVLEKFETVSGDYTYSFTPTVSGVHYLHFGGDSSLIPYIQDNIFYIDNILIKDTTLEVPNYTDYYPFGMLVPKRHDNSSAYRYGFNGMEKDDEAKGGNGNSYTTQFRAYDPRIGRWLSLDPLMAKYPNQSPFAGFNNNPIYFADPTGLEGQGSGDPPKKHTVEKGDTLGKLAKKFDTTVEALMEWNDIIKEKKHIEIGWNLNVSNPDLVSDPATSSSTEKWHAPMMVNDNIVTSSEMKTPINKYIITNPDLKDINKGQYAVDPNAFTNVGFITYIDPSIYGNNLTVSGRVWYTNPTGDPISFTFTASLYDNNGQLIEEKILSSNLDYSNGKMYFQPEGWVGTTTFRLIDADDIKAHNYSVEVESTGSVKTDGGYSVLTHAGLFISSGDNGFDVTLIKK